VRVTSATGRTGRSFLRLSASLSPLCFFFFPYRRDGFFLDLPCRAYSSLFWNPPFLFSMRESVPNPAVSPGLLLNPSPDHTPSSITISCNRFPKHFCYSLCLKLPFPSFLGLISNPLVSSVSGYSVFFYRWAFTCPAISILNYLLSRIMGSFFFPADNKYFRSIPDSLPESTTLPVFSRDLQI